MPGTRPFDAEIYAPDRKTQRAWLVVPGLHFLGPEDPRLDRFCRILAASGATVLSPYLPDYRALRLETRVVDDAERAFDLLRSEVPGVLPSVFSISFGSFPAVELAARRGTEIRRLVIFGGYASFRDVVRFSTSRDADPLGQAVVFLNLVDRGMEGAPADPSAIQEAWREFARRTWGREEMKGEARHEVARAIAATLPESARRLYLVGCGTEPGGAAICEQVLARELERLEPDGRGIACPVSIFHGVDDDVIPAAQAAVFAARIPAAGMRLTGMYGHASKAKAGAALKEAGTLLKMLAALAG